MYLISKLDTILIVFIFIFEINLFYSKIKIRIFKIYILKFSVFHRNLSKQDRFPIKRFKKISCFMRFLKNNPLHNLIFIMNLTRFNKQILKISI